MYKVLFWALMFVIYVAMMWVLPAYIVNLNTYLMNVLGCHIFIVAIIALAGLIAFLEDKAFN